MPAPTRRTLLGAGLAGLAAGGLTACDEDGGAASSSSAGTSGGASSSPADGASDGAPTSSDGPQIPDFDPEDWESVRAQFPLDPSVSQFAAFVLSPHTAQVAAAIDYHRDRLSFDTEQALLDGFQLEDEVRRAAGNYTGAVPAEFALTDSTTMGIAHMYGGLSLSADDEVLSTTHDFFSTEEALRLLALRSGAQVRTVTLYDDPETATVDEMTSRLIGAVGPRTRVVAITWVHSSTGVRVPVQEIGAALADLNRDRDQPVLLCVDGVHGFAAVDVDLPDLGCDFLSAGTHKWLFGPRGTGILWARNWGPLTELIPSFSGFENGARLTPGGYHDFEHRWALTEAFAFHMRIGRARVVERTVSQASQLKDGLLGISSRKIRVVTPTDPAVSAGIVCIDVAPMLPGNAVMALREQGIVASATPYRTSYLRLGPSLVTTPEQVDAAIGAVATLS